MTALLAGGPRTGAPANYAAQADALADRFDALGRFVRLTWGHVAAAPEMSDVDASAVAAAGVLSERAAARLRLAGGHTVVALAGATGSGKSSMFNALARMNLSATGHLRPTTGAAHACVWGERGADDLLDWLGVTHRFRRESPLDAQDEASLHGLVLLDLPDLDSVATGHRLEAERLVGVVDLVVWVLDPQKYADQSVHGEYLRHMGPLRDVTVVVFNQADRLSPADTNRCLADLRRLLDADGLPDVPILATSVRSGAGVNRLRRLLERTVAGRHAGLARLEGELDEAVGGLVPLVRDGHPSAAEDALDRHVVSDFAGELADAAGVMAVAADAGRSYARRARVPGWPLRPRGAGAVPADRRVPPADPAAVAVAVRRMSATAGARLPAPWPDQIQAAVGGGLDRLPDELGDALTRVNPPLPSRAGWAAARVLWWLAVLAAVAGLGWLAGAAWDGGGVQPPRPGGVSLPVLLIGVGFVLAVAVPLVCLPLARLCGRRYADRVLRRLREAAGSVARDSVGPARLVLRDYSAARSALEIAATRTDGG